MIPLEVKWAFRLLADNKHVISSQMVIALSEIIVTKLDDKTHRSTLVFKYFRDFIYQSVYMGCYPESIDLCLL